MEEGTTEDEGATTEEDGTGVEEDEEDEGAVEGLMGADGSSELEGLPSRSPLPVR